MKQQYTGPYTFDVAARTITLAGIEVPQDRLALIVNSTVGFIYHNLEHEPTAQVTISGGNTVIVFPRYKDCETHQNTDALSIFYDDGVDLGQLIKDESDETQALLQAEFDETQVALADFRTEGKAESDETQTLLQNEFDETQTAIADFRAEVKAGFDETQTLLQTEFDETQTALADFQAEVKSESDQTQGLLTEIQTTFSEFKTEAKVESDETQTLLNLKLAGLINGFLGVEHIVKYSAENGFDIEIVPATFDGVNRNTGYSPSQIVFSQGGVHARTIFLYYDNEGRLILVTSQHWTPSLLDTRAIWLDASDLTSIVTSGQYVTRWNSQLDSTWSARPFDNPPTTDSRPKSGVATINGLNAIAFDAVDDDLLTYKDGIRRALADVDQGAQYFKEAVFIVARRNAASKSRWLSAGVSGNRNFGTFFTDLGVNRMILDIGLNRVDYYYPAAFPAVGMFSFFVDSTAPSSELFFNGTRVSLDTTPFDMFAGRQDGVGGTTTGPGSGDDFGEVLVLREVPDRATRQKIEGYMAHKWGLTGGLPADHPYKLWPPGVSA